MTDDLSPKKSLENYFDDLLGGEELLAHPVKTTVIHPAILPSAVSEVKTKKRSDVNQFADQDIERKQKLARLLQTAHPTIALDTPAVALPTPVKVDVEEIQDWVIESAVSEVEEIIGVTAEAVPEETIHLIADLEWLENGRPAWAQTRFDVLLFQVSGLTLAVPLISLGQIQPLTDELTPLFGQADWFMGLQPTAAGKVRTVNTAKFVMPERYDESFLKTAKYVVSINGVPWGLAVDSVNQPIRLEPEDVNWRSERSKRPWLAGTVKAHMCALLDIPRIGQMLVDADRNANKKTARRKA